MSSGLEGGGHTYLEGNSSKRRRSTRSCSTSKRAAGWSRQSAPPARLTSVPRGQVASVACVCVLYAGLEVLAADEPVEEASHALGRLGHGVAASAHSARVSHANGGGQANNGKR